MKRYCIYLCLKVERFIWKLRYAWYMYRYVPGIKWIFCWHSAKAMSDDLDGFPDEHPHDAVHTEMSYWGD